MIGRFYDNQSKTFVTADFYPKHKKKARLAYISYRKT